MSFRVKLRIKSVKPYQRPAPAVPGLLPKIDTDADLLRKLYEAAKMPCPLDGDVWTRHWPLVPGLPDPRFNPTFSVSTPPGINYIAWNGGVQ